jgi:hypothetical protein
MANTTTIKDGAGTDRLIASRDISATVRSPTFDQDNAASPTYRYAVQGFSPVATPTVIATIGGSATKTIRVKKVILTGVATAAGMVAATLAKCSDAGTPNTALTQLTGVPLDSGDAAATGTVGTVGTANYTTVPTVIGAIDARRIPLAVVATGNVVPVVFDFTQHAVVLRGVAQTLTIALNGAALPTAGLIDITVETCEDAS